MKDKIESDIKRLIRDLNPIKYKKERLKLQAYFEALCKDYLNHYICYNQILDYKVGFLFTDSFIEVSLFIKVNFNFENDINFKIKAELITENEMFTSILSILEHNIIEQSFLGSNIKPVGLHHYDYYKQNNNTK